jgi:hypothetical protein
LARNHIDVLIAADESIRKADDPLRVAREQAADLVVVKVAPLGGVRRALEIVAECGLPAVVSSAIDTSIGIASGVALAAALPELEHACGRRSFAGRAGRRGDRGRGGPGGSGRPGAAGPVGGAPGSGRVVAFPAGRLPRRSRTRGAVIDIRWVWAFLDTPQEAVPSAWEFWSEVLGCRLSARRGERGQFATLLPQRGLPWVKVQAIAQGGGVHLDLDVDEPAAAALVARGLGARERARFDNDEVVVMESPGRFAFCLTRWQPAEPGRQRQERGGHPALLDQVCLDIPPMRYAGELAFWSRLTGWPAVGNARPEVHRLRRPAGIPLQLLLQRLDAGGGTVTGHPDLASTDRRSEVVRQVGLGAKEVGPGHGWTVMRDPAGQVYCITDRRPETGS